MESFVEVMTVILNGFNQPFTVYGFTLSFYDIWLWSIVALSPPHLLEVCCRNG